MFRIKKKQSEQHYNRGEPRTYARVADRMIQYKNNANQNFSLKDGSSENLRIYAPVLQDRTGLRLKNGDIQLKDCQCLKLTIQKVIDLSLPKEFELR